MALRRRLALVGLAALIFCLPGKLHAGESIADGRSLSFTVSLSSFQPIAKIELSVTPALPGWEVTAAYDSALCEIHCSWRRKRDAFGRTPTSLMLPPIAAIRVYTGFASAPAIWTVDPAGLGLPDATKDTLLVRETIFVPARKLVVTTVTRLYNPDACSLSLTHFFSLTNRMACAATALPLRI